MKMKKRLISIAMAAVMAVGSIPAAGALLDGFNNTSTYSDQFTDVPSTAWYYNSVKSRICPSGTLLIAVYAESGSALLIQYAKCQRCS